MSKSTRQQQVFPGRLRRARVMRGLSQLELGTRARLQQAAVSLYENGERRPSLRNLRHLSEALEVTTDFLLGRSESPESAPSGDESLFENFGRLSLEDRQLARDLVAQLAQRATKSRSS